MVDNVEKEIDSILAETTQDMSNSEEELYKSENAQTAEIDEESTQVFNLSLQQYLAIDDEKGVLQDAIRKKNQQKKSYEQTMIAYLNNNNIQNITLDGSYKNRSLETEVKTVATGFSRMAVIEVLEECIGSDSELFDKIMSKLSERMVSKEVTKLKMIDLNKKKSNKQRQIADNNATVESIIEKAEASIPENLRYLYAGASS